MIPFRRDKMRGGIILMYRNSKKLPSLNKSSHIVKKLKCWLEDLVVEQDYCCCFNVLWVFISIHQNDATSHLVPGKWDYINRALVTSEGNLKCIKLARYRPCTHSKIFPVRMGGGLIPE